jgi:hypothetical protein
MFTCGVATQPSLLRIALFPRPISYGHAICVSGGVRKIFHHPDPSGEPTPAFASEAEIELAEQLRHRLEARLLETAVARSSSEKTLAETTDAINSSTR